MLINDNLPQIGGFPNEKQLLDEITKNRQDAI